VHRDCRDELADRVDAARDVRDHRVAGRRRGAVVVFDAEERLDASVALGVGRAVEELPECLAAQRAVADACSGGDDVDHRVSIVPWARATRSDVVLGAEAAVGAGGVHLGLGAVAGDPDNAPAPDSLPR
jgi:hypothetical protein